MSYLIVTLGLDVSADATELHLVRTVPQNVNVIEHDNDILRHIAVLSEGLLSAKKVYWDTFWKVVPHFAAT